MGLAFSAHRVVYILHQNNSRSITQSIRNFTCAKWPAVCSKNAQQNEKRLDEKKIYKKHW